VQADTIYVAPTSGSAVTVRVGPRDVTSSTGFIVGTGARDGVGVSLDAKGNVFCTSTGAAQDVDVVTGKR
jgi:hypothetical protein